MSARDRIRQATETNGVDQRLTAHQMAIHSLRLQLMSIAQAANGALAALEALEPSLAPAAEGPIKPKTLPNLPPARR